MTGAGNNTWLIDGAEPTLIDAGVGVPQHLDALAAALGTRPLRRVIVTHGHPDHASGVPAIAARWPDVEICRWTPVTNTDRAVVDDEYVVAGDDRLKVIHTPGHAMDHICLWREETGSVYAGDMLVLGSTVMIPPGKGGGLRAYLRSLERLAALRPSIVFPGHGDVIRDPLPLIAEYIAHRNMRTEQVAACLAAGIADPDAIVARIYPDIVQALRPAARATVEAHVEYLREGLGG
jgi:glyoxylase-like metal-dependent hydrolase (beta-lactamase superfamily II)